MAWLGSFWGVTVAQSKALSPMATFDPKPRQRINSSSRRRHLAAIGLNACPCGILQTQLGFVFTVASDEA